MAKVQIAVSCLILFKRRLTAIEELFIVKEEYDSLYTVVLWVCVLQRDEAGAGERDARRWLQSEQSERLLSSLATDTFQLQLLTHILPLLLSFSVTYCPRL